MKLRLDPWATEYNTAYYADEVAQATPDHIDPYVETQDWKAITPLPNDLTWEKLLFIDGSRRIEARLLLEDDQEHLAFGAMGTYAVGVVNCCPKQSRQASIYETHVKRICALSSGHTMDNFFIAPLGKQLGVLEYEVVSSNYREAEAVVMKLQEVMLEEESRIASCLAQEENTLIICDGQRPHLSKDANVIGYLKTIHDTRLSREHLAIVRLLEQGQRSPIYQINVKDSFYFEWFLRLRDPRPWFYSLAGMVRIQAYGTVLCEVLELANWTCHTLPKFASKQHQDPRAPQQLLPIRALESELKRRMGNPQIIRRRITEHLSHGG
jgi:uncharacterized protein